MKKTILITVFLALVACNPLGAMCQTIYEEPHKIEMLDSAIARRLKYGFITETSIKPSMKRFTSNGPFQFTDYGFSCFNTEGTVLKCFKKPKSVFFDRRGIIVAEHPEQFEEHATRLQIKSREGFCDDLLAKDLVNRITQQTLYSEYINESEHFINDTYAAIEYPEKKSSEDMFIFEHPLEPETNYTLPCYSQGLVCAIMSKFPLELTQGTMNDRDFNTCVMHDIEKNKHVCLYEIKDKKLELLRNLGNYPYCVGCYINPQKTLVAVLHGDNINEQKCLKLIAINVNYGPALTLLSKAKKKFTDILINCEK